MGLSVGRPFLLPPRLETRLLTTTHALSFYNIRIFGSQWDRDQCSCIIYEHGDASGQEHDRR